MAGYYPPDPKDRLIADMLEALVSARAVIADEVERRGDEDASYVVPARPALDMVDAAVRRGRDARKEAVTADVASPGRRIPEGNAHR